jgi:hypothetical protein
MGAGVGFEPTIEVYSEPAYETGDMGQTSRPRIILFFEDGIQTTSARFDPVNHIYHLARNLANFALNFISSRQNLDDWPQV